MIVKKRQRVGRIKTRNAHSVIFISFLSIRIRFRAHIDHHLEFSNRTTHLANILFQLLLHSL